MTNVGYMHTDFYKQPSSRSSEGFLTFGYILVLKVSLKFANAAN